MLNLLDRVLYRDGMMLVLDKPAGWSCTPTGPGVHLTRFLPALTFGKTTLPQVAHRLDRETTGCLLLGRHPKALRELGRLFQERKISKTYWAMVHGHWPAELTCLDEPIEGQEAITMVRCLQQFKDQTWLELKPVTGRTHQLRIHCSQRGHAIVGDTKYGGGDGAMKLHAQRVEVPMNPKKPPIVVEAPSPWTL